jgi:hypothetical protein
MIFNNIGKTWKDQELFFHVLLCNITIDGKISMIDAIRWNRLPRLTGMSKKDTKREM